MIEFTKVLTEFGGNEKLETIVASNGKLIQRITTWDTNWGKKSNVIKGQWSVGNMRFDSITEAKKYLRN